MTADGHIAGIYNYCDRWCDRCEFTARCRLFQMDETDPADSEANDPHHPKFWISLKRVLQKTRELIQDLARQQGMDLEAVDVEEAHQRMEERFRRARQHPLVCDGFRYIDAVDNWFCRNEEVFAARQAELGERALLGLGGLDPEWEANRLGEACEVIRWHQHQITAKLIRALSSASDGDGADSALTSSDADGSAKVALLGIDDSLAAWTILRNCLSDESDAILDFLVQLNRLRRDTETAFPRARAFVRPGFDGR